MSRSRSFVALLTSCTVVGCAPLLHPRSADLDLPLEQRPWRVRCGWYVQSPAAPDTLLANPKQSGTAWASDSAGRRLIVDGRIEDGFFVVERARAASDDDDLDMHAYPATGNDLRQACTAALTAAAEDERPRLHSITATREGEESDLSIVVPGDAALPRPVSRMVVFGDSLSDSGNLIRELLIFPRSPYWLGRFSNGPNWTDYLSERTGITISNRAFGGAAITKHEQVPNVSTLAAIEQGGQFFLTGSIEQQVSDYMNRDLRGRPVRQPGEVVFVFWGGSMDYMTKEPFTGEITTLLDAPDGVGGYRRMVRDAVASVTGQIRRLHAVGGRQFVVVNLPDIGKSPIVLQNKSYTAVGRAKTDTQRRLLLARKLSDLSAYHNQQLATAVATLTRKLRDAKIVVVDVSDLMDRILASRAVDDTGKKFDYGFALKDGAVELRDGPRRASFQQRCYTGSYVGATDPATVCRHAQTALFWDVVHPTSYAHCWIGYGVQRALAKARLARTPPSPERQLAYCRARTQPTW